MRECGTDPLTQVSFQRLSPLIENIEVFVVGVKASVVASSGFAGDAEFGQMLQSRGHRRGTEF